MSATRKSPLQIPSANSVFPMNIPGKTFLPKLVGPWLVSCRNRLIFNHCPKRNLWSVEWFFESPFIRNFTLCQGVLNISQKAIAFHRISPPFFIQARLPTVQQTFLLLLCAPISHKYHSSRIHEVSKFDYSVINLYKICQITMNCHCKWLSAFLMVWETFLNFFCLLWSFGFTRIKLYPLSGEILYHDSVSVIVLRFTFLVEDLVICWYHITKLFCLRYCFASASSARCPQSSRFASILHNFGLVGSEYKHCAFLSVTFAGCSESESWEMCAGAGTSVFLRFSVISCNHSGRSRRRPSGSRLLSLFLSLFWVFGDSRQFPGASSWLRSVAGLDDAVDESCGGDVEDGLVPDLDDNPGTTRGTKCSVLQRIFFPCLVWVWPLTAGVLVGITVFFAELSKWWNCRRVIEYLHRQEEINIVHVFLCFLVCLHFSVGRYHRCGVPGSQQSLHFVWAPILFCLACALMLRSQPRMLVSLEMLKWAPALPWLQKESKT